MKKLLLRFALLSFIYLSASICVKAQSYTIITIAGTGVAGYNGDNIQATTSELHNPYGLCTDNSSNVYTADYYNDRVRKVNTSGVITTLAGTGVAGFSGDGGQATAAQLSQPSDCSWCAANGNLYICDEVNERIRMVNTSGIITTIAGNGVLGYSGDGGPATAAEMYYPFGVLYDNVTGNVYVAEFRGARVRKITPAGIITTYAGNGVMGYSGDGGQATAAELNAPLKVALDNAGNMYVADAYNNRIRKITPGGIITTFAGTGAAGFSGDGGQATAAMLNWTFGVGCDGTNVYPCDFSNARVRMINTSGIINTIAGTGVAGFNGDGSPATTKQLYQPSQLAAGPGGNLYISEYGNHRDRKLTNNVLPITLNSFTADYLQQNNSVLCRWDVATQTNNRLFTVEKSVDGITYVMVGTLPGAGTTSVSANYSMQDNNPFTGTSYYRLKQTDFDGHETTFDPMAVTVSPLAGTVSLYPNPVNESATLTYYSGMSEPITITIMDALGRTVNTENQNVQKGNNALTINTSTLAKGLYFMRINGSSQNSFIKFIKD